ncbi:hypothetical protein DPPLL_22420 [Desulfofustis limnaeus]|uniref:Uncharacterized protein n=1 Tax=Desulfofustis limnaeus TaxID=2740163 RepID=A0ABM7WA92_9BACT|nr:hypothetical protein DPPLL_22420 [Desulfofustis limnaeus]
MSSGEISLREQQIQTFVFFQPFSYTEYLDLGLDSGAFVGTVVRIPMADTYDINLFGTIRIYTEDGVTIFRRYV